MTLTVNSFKYPRDTTNTAPMVQAHDIIMDEVKHWVVGETKLIKTSDVSIVDTIIHNLGTFNLKHLNDAGCRSHLHQLLNSSVQTEQHVRDRLDSFILSLYLQLGETTLKAFKGRFYVVLYDQFKIGIKHLDWLDTTYSNIWILPFIQKSYQLTFVSSSV